MSNWQKIIHPPIHADVIRWIEPIFHYPKSKKSKPTKIGSRSMITEVLKIDGDWAHLLVKDCTMKSIDTMRNIEVIKPDTEIKRKMNTLLRNNPERLLWSDETARTEVLKGI